MKESQQNFLKSLFFFLCQTRRCMLVNKLVNPDEVTVTDTIILISFCHSGVLMCISITFPLFLFFPVPVLFFHPYFNNTLRVSKFQSLNSTEKENRSDTCFYTYLYSKKKKKNTRRSSVTHKRGKNAYLKDLRVSSSLAIFTKMF